MSSFSNSITAAILPLSFTCSLYGQKDPNLMNLSERNFPRPEKMVNIILIMTDQQRADLTKREGYPLDVTPFVDKLAKGGVWFNRAYCSSPACVPSRTSTLTGRFPSSTHVRSNHNLNDAYFQYDLSDVLKYRGYQSALVGKNHSFITKADFNDIFIFNHQAAFDSNSSDQKKKFDEYMQTLNYNYDPNPSPFPLEMQYPYRIVSKSLEWIQTVKEKPFFLWMSFAEPHNPYQVPPPYYNMFPPEKLPPVIADESTLPLKGFSYQKQHELCELVNGDMSKLIPRMRSNYMGMLRLIDDQVKRFVTTIESEGLMENTVIIIVSDHGDYAGEYGLVRKGAGTPEVLMRIPMVWYGKNIKPLTTASTAHVSNVDIFPTICEITGVDIPNGVEGRSLLPILTGKTYPKKEFAAAYAEMGFGGLKYDQAQDTLDPYKEGAATRTGFFDELNSWTQSGSQRMLRADDWKLEYDMMGNGALYNLKSDPSEINNLWNSPACQTQKASMLEELLRRTIRYQDEIPIPRNRYIMKKDIRNYFYK